MEVSSTYRKVDANERFTPLSAELLDILQSSTLPETPFGFDKPYAIDEFKEYSKKIQSNLSKSISLLNSLTHFEEESLSKDIAFNTVLLCGEHSENNIWTTSESIRLSDSLLKELLNKCNCSNLSDLLVQFSCDLVLSKLRFKLDKSSWKNFPAAVVCFKWILINLKCPNLGGALDKVLPTCLILVDDHEYRNKCIGLNCLQHVITNVSRSELTRHGIDTVIYKAVEHMLYLREPEIIKPLASCLVVLLSSSQHQPNITTLKWNHFDDVLNIWLSSMEMEQKVLLREAYIDSIDPLIAAMGLSSVRWSRKLINILAEYCEQENTEEKALQCLQTFIHASWPRATTNFESIVLILIKVVLRSASRNEKKFHLVNDCLQSLEKLCEPQYMKLIGEIKDKSELSFLNSVLTVH